MNKQEIQDHLFAVLKEEFEISDDQLTLDAKLYDDLGIDSIDAVDLIVQMKNIIGRRIPPENFKSVRTVGDVIEVIASLQK
ncbi:UNVERIFIED_CONTAM: hypothetical protein GTU68_017647 [Idotea baltica]|nr:hypothetical protein [Idotea baltica]